MVFNRETVRLDGIDRSDLSFRITTRMDADDLIPSMRTGGLINSPILTRRSGAYAIVAGFRRILACQTLGLAEIRARIAPRGARPLDLTAVAIADNALQRPLDLIEKSRALALLAEFHATPRDLARAAAPLGLPRNPSLVRKILPLHSLPEVIREGVRSNAISLPMAHSLDQLDLDAGVELANLFLTLKLSLNKQREILALSEEIAARDDIPLPELLAREAIRGVLNDKNLDRSQKAGRIRLHLKRERFPRLTKAQETFEENLKRLKLGPGARLTPPRNFEGLAYSLDLQFKNRAELRERRATLDSLLNNPALENILPE